MWTSYVLLRTKRYQEIFCVLNSLIASEPKH